MRSYSESTARNLLRRPLIFGVPLTGLLVLTFMTLVLHVCLGNAKHGVAGTLGFAFTGYLTLRVFAHFAMPGWEEGLIYALEKLVNRTKPKLLPSMRDWAPSIHEVIPPDTLEPIDLLRQKSEIETRLNGLKLNQEIRFVLDLGPLGANLHEMVSSDEPESHFRDGYKYVYSLFQLPVATDPLTVFYWLTKEALSLRVLIRIQGKATNQIKRQIEQSRRRTLQAGRALTDLDAEVTFEESSRVLSAISRGLESVVELSLVVLSQNPTTLDPELFVLERNQRLALSSVTGIRKRFHRSHLVRSVTASDLIPNVFDPCEPGLAILKTRRALPLYFSPQDPRLEALHWLVVGASGSGKSFLSGLILKRLIERHAEISVIFVDHNRSFRRLVLANGGRYLEPSQLGELENGLSTLCESWNQPQSISGIELSDLDISDKKSAAHLLLSNVEAFLRSRDTIHPVYLVLDECWNLMRDEPVLVQRAFREFRKLNGAVVAITQSLSDFLSDQSGQSICQNAPIRILLRQGEDISRYQGILGLNSVETELVRHLRQRRGIFSECLIKTPFLSRVGRLYPSALEHECLRTDNIREERIRESRVREAMCATTP